MDQRKRLEQMSHLCALTQTDWDLKAAELANLLAQDADLKAQITRAKSPTPAQGIAEQLAGMEIARARWQDQTIRGLNGKRARLGVRIEQAKSTTRLAFGRRRAAQKLFEKLDRRPIRYPGAPDQ